MNTDRRPVGLATRILSSVGLFGLARKILASSGRYVLTFHGVSRMRQQGVNSKSQPHHTKEELASTLSWLRRRFDFLSPEAFLAGRPGVLATFDDGFSNNHRNALPVLETLGIPAVFFVTTQHVANPNDWLAATRAQASHQWISRESVPPELADDFYNGMSVAQLQECSSNPLITIGSHTISHPMLPDCDDTSLDFELEHSKELLEDWTGKPVDLFAYPAGQYDRRVAERTRELGYKAAFALDSQEVGMPMFEIPRIGLYHAVPSYLAAKTSGLHRKPLTGMASTSIATSEDR